MFLLSLLHRRTTTQRADRPLRRGPAPGTEGEPGTGILATRHVDRAASFHPVTLVAGKTL
jgi:hypothetical protein